MATSALKHAVSAVHKGTAFENRSLRLLQEHLSMKLSRVGGRSDGGIDLQGWWWLPLAHENTTGAESLQESMRLRILAQCKAEKKKIGPNYVREMEGVLHRYVLEKNGSTGLAQEPVVGMLISSSPFSQSAMLRAHSSTLPLCLLHIPPVESEDNPHPIDDTSGFGSVVFNPTLGGTQGLFKGQIQPRWEQSGKGSSRPGLWRDGVRIKNYIP